MAHTPAARLSLLAAAALISAAGPAAAESPTAPAAHCRVEIELDPARGTIEGRARYSLTAVEDHLHDGRLELLLHDALRLDAVAAFGHELEPTRQPGADGVDRYLVAIDEPSGVVAVDLAWSGVLRQDVAAGEVPGDIHNRAMRAHIGDDGIYLAPEAAWHPRLAERSCSFTLEVSSPWPVTASGDASRADGRATWRTPFPLPALTVVGGDHEIHQRQVGDVLVRAQLAPGSAPFAAGILDAVESYLDLYVPLLGPYPYRQFTVVENFFSSGFAFPGFTLLSPQVVAMGARSLRPGYLDHELLHNWWGNGVLPAEDSGRWSEALASYCANYMRPILEGDEGRGRRYRRNVIETLSRSHRLAGQVLGDYGASGVSSFVGYQKGAVVFDQLAGQIGQDALWAGLRRLARERMGRPTGWDDLRRAFEAESGRELSSFFEYWVAGPGLPAIVATRAAWSDGVLHVDTTSDAPFTVGLPIRIHGPGGVENRVARVEPGAHSMQLEIPVAPAEIEVDPDFRVLRRLAPERLMPTLAAVGPSQPLTLVLGEGELAGYDDVREDLRERSGSGAVLKERRKFRSRWLAGGNVVILGSAARSDAVARLFAGRLTLHGNGFEVPPVRYVADGDAVLACVRNPERPGAVVCVFWANGAAALEQARLLTFYGGNSLLVFDHGRPVERRDFDLTERLPVVVS